MKTAWITPTYLRPRTLANLIACFLAQDYPPELLDLIILDDAGQYGPSCRGDRWQVISIDRRFHSLPAKFNALAGLTDADAIIVAEDDDSFLSHHTAAHVAALQRGEFSKPSTVLTDCPGHIITERSDGRFHGSIAFRRSLWERCGGWPVVHAANFDQQMLRHFEAHAGGITDPNDNRGPSYVFRWHTGHYHGQSMADSPTDQNWYAQAARLFPQDRIESITPKFDALTESMYAVFNARESVEPNAGLAIPRRS